MMKRFLVVPLILLFFPLLSPAQNKIAERPIGQIVVSFSATPVFDAGQSHSFKIILTGNVTSSTVIGMEAGQELTFEVCQDGVGARTFAWPALMVGPIAILAGVNVCTVETFHYDGTSAYIWTTTTSGGGGSGTVNSGTGGHYTYYGANGTTVSSNANLDDSITNALALTYAGANGIFATQYNSTASGAFTVVGTEGTVSGAAAGKDVLACGDITSHSCQISNNGDSFRSILTSLSTSPVPHGPLVAGTTFPQTVSISRGTQGQPLLEGAAAGDPGYGQLDLSLSTNVINALPKANQAASTVYNDQINTFAAAGTLNLSGSTSATAFRIPNVAGATSTTNGVQRYDTTSNNYHFGMNGADAIVPLFTSVPPDARCIHSSIVSGNLILTPAAGDCSVPGGAGALSGLTAAVAPNSINNGDNAQTWNANLTTAGKHWFTITENSASTATGVPYLHDIHSIASSTANPLIVTALGTANGWNLLNAGALWAPVGAGTLAIPGTAHGTVISQSGTTATTTVAPGTAGQVLISNGAGADPAYADPITSGNQAAATTQTITATGALTGVTITSIGTVLVTVSGTYAGVAFNFEASPDGTFTPAFPVAGSQLDANSILFNTGALPSNTTRSWLVDAAGFTKFRVNATAYTSGTANITITPVYHQYVPWTNANISAIAAGSSIIGKVGIDQTTPGTTNAVSETNLPATVDTNSGNKSASTLRVVLATDQPALTNKLLVTPDSVALPANQSVNVNQKAGTALIADPCEVNAKVYDSFSGTANTQLITGTSAKKIYFCSFTILVGAATNVAIVEGTGTVCATGIAKFPGLSGGTTAATGWNFSANGGLTYGNGGSSIAGETTNADNVCVLVSAANQTNISYSYVVQ